MSIIMKCASTCSPLCSGHAFLLQAGRSVLRRAGESQSDRCGQRLPVLSAVRRQAAVRGSHHQPEGGGVRTDWFKQSERAQAID